MSLMVLVKEKMMAVFFKSSVASKCYKFIMHYATGWPCE
jgi:hypothetical protein